MLRALPLLLLLPACDLFSLTPPTVDDTPSRPTSDDDDCDRDSDCDGGEFCDDGVCRDIDDVGEGEGEPPPPPPPTCSGAGCPEILSLTSNRSTMREFDDATLSAVVTDPDGVDDVIGGVLLDPTSDDVYGTFVAASAGAFSMNVSWSVLNPVRAISFDGGGVARTLRARFFDQAGNEVFGDVVVTLACSDSDVACDGVCGSASCDGDCLSERDFVTDDNCGGCGVACPANGSCSTQFGPPQCLCSGGPCGGEGEGDVPTGGPYSGDREPGVVCGTAGTCDETCCIDLTATTPICVADGACFIGGASCDGPEDCGFGEECCVTSFTASCVAAGSCRDSGGQEVCVNNGDCAAGEACCLSTTAATFGGDAGVCTTSADGFCP